MLVVQELVAGEPVGWEPLITRLAAGDPVAGEPAELARVTAALHGSLAARWAPPRRRSRCRGHLGPHLASLAEASKPVLKR